MERYFIDYWARETNISENHAEFKLCLSAETMLFMPHHFFGGKCLIPAAVLAEAMLAACRLLVKEETFWPISVDKLDIFYGLQVDINDSTNVIVKADVVERGPGHAAFFAELIGDRKNEQGQVMRRNIRLASGEISTGRSWSKEVNSALKVKEYKNFKISPEKYYSLFSATHKFLFQTMTGNFRISLDKNICVSEFEVGDKEDGFSNIPGLNFNLSPLGTDSILQTAVFQSVLNAQGESELVLSKIPVGIEGLWMKENFIRKRKYYCFLELVANSEQDMELSGFVEDFAGSIIGTVERIKLKKAPFLKFKRGEPIRLLEKYS